MRLSLLALLLVAPAFAQSGDVTFTGGIALTGGFTRLGYDGETLDTFDRTFSEFYAQRLDAPTDLLPDHVQGLSGGATARVRADGVEFALGYTYARGATDARAVFENDSGLRVTTTSIDQASFLEVLVAVVPRVTVGPVIQASLREDVIRAAWVYPDGSESVGSEYRINGIYRDVGGSRFLFEAGGTLRLAITDRITVPVRVLFDLPEPGGASGIPMRDDDVQAFNDAFPLDFQAWAADPAGLNDAVAVQPEHLEGMRVEAGVEVIVLKF